MVNRKTGILSAILIINLAIPSFTPLNLVQRKTQSSNNNLAISHPKIMQQDADSDGDGVSDFYDFCPNSPISDYCETQNGKCVDNSGKVFSIDQWGCFSEEPHQTTHDCTYQAAGLPSQVGTETLLSFYLTGTNISDLLGLDFKTRVTDGSGTSGFTVYSDLRYGGQDQSQIGSNFWFYPNDPETPPDLTKIEIYAYGCTSSAIVEFPLYANAEETSNQALSSTGACDVQMQITPNPVNAGESAVVQLDVRSDGQPYSGASVMANITDGPGTIDPYQAYLDSNGQAYFSYVAPADLTDATWVTVGVEIPNCASGKIMPLSFQVLGGASVGEANPAEVVPAAINLLKVSTNPTCFQELDQQIALDVFVGDSSGAPLGDEKVTLTSVENSADSLKALTNSNGIVEFLVTHYDPQAASYSFTIQAAGLAKTITLPVLSNAVTIEVNPDTGEPFQGVAADGASTLVLSLYLPNLVGKTVKFIPPILGTLTGDTLNETYDEIELDSSGRAYISYKSPAYLMDTSKLTTPIQIYRTNTSTSTAYAATDQVVFSMQDSNGEAINIPVNILIVRPAVMLVHGFIGDETTWANLGWQLGMDKFDASIDAYQYSTIEDCAFSLKKNIEDMRLHYGWSNIKLSKVDIVAHSMGGVLSRYYIEQMPDYQRDVRKLIMVGTPNHGVCDWKAILGDKAAWWYERNARAADELFSGSAFMYKLNYNEPDGGNLNYDVEYANLIGGLRAYPLSDGIVTHSSAQLNGVSSDYFDNTSHSTAIPFPMNTAITEDKRVWAKVEELLLKEIYRPPLQGSRIEVTRLEGEFSVSDVQGSSKTIQASPLDVKPWQYLKTGQGKAIISLYLGDERWGLVSMRPETELVFDYAAPDLVRILVQQGTVRFLSLIPGAQVDRHFEIVSGEFGEQWYQFQPRAYLTSTGTDFTMQVDPSQVQIYVMDGQIKAESFDPVDSELVSESLISPSQATMIDKAGNQSTLPETPQAWWEEDDFFDVSDLSYGNVSASNLLITASMCLWVVALLALIIVLVINRKKPVKKWLRVGLIIFIGLMTVVFIVAVFAAQ